MPPRLVIRLVLHPSAGPDTPDRAVAGVRAALDAAGATAPAIEVETVSEIEREPGGAKVKLIKSL